MTRAWWHDLPLRLRLLFPIAGIVAVAVLAAIVLVLKLAPMGGIAVGAIWFGILLPALAIVYAVLRHLLQPLEDIARVAQQEDPSEHLAGSSTPPELATIAARINHLLAELAEARALNAQLHRDVAELREDERRRIANELHDEAGPCLFGISANLSSMRRIVDELPKAQSERLQQRMAEISEITDRLKAFNRDMLRNLHPVQLGQLPLADVIEGLVAGFRRQHPEAVFTFDAGALANGYGKEADLAIYRAAQEAITNALRHGGATRVEVDVREMTASAGAGSKSATNLRLQVQDNGRGSASDADAGIGLTAMRARAMGLGGSVAIEDAAAGGTIVTVTVPVPAQD